MDPIGFHIKTTESYRISYKNSKPYRMPYENKLNPIGFHMKTNKPYRVRTMIQFVQFRPVQFWFSFGFRFSFGSGPPPSPSVQFRDPPPHRLILRGPLERLIHLRLSGTPYHYHHCRAGFLISTHTLC